MVEWIKKNRVDVLVLIMGLIVFCLCAFWANSGKQEKDPSGEGLRQLSLRRLLQRLWPERRRNLVRGRGDDTGSQGEDPGGGLLGRGVRHNCGPGIRDSAPI